MNVPDYVLDMQMHRSSLQRNFSEFLIYDDNSILEENHATEKFNLRNLKTNVLNLKKVFFNIPKKFYFKKTKDKYGIERQYKRHKIVNNLQYSLLETAGILL